MPIRPVLFAALVALFGVQLPAAESLELNPKESKIEFVGSKPDGKHEGGFRKFEAEAVPDIEDPSNSSLKIAIDASSLWSDNTKLTNHLKNPDFFDVRKYPEITFESTEVVFGDEGKATFAGKMKMLDKVVDVEIPVSSEATERQLTLTADFSIDRTKWGMAYGQGKIDNQVKIKAHLVFQR